MSEEKLEKKIKTFAQMDAEGEKKKVTERKRKVRITKMFCKLEKQVTQRGRDEEKMEGV